MVAEPGAGRWLRALLAAALVAVVLVPREPLDAFSYHAWRKTQTYAVYHCLSDAGDVRTAAVCFFAQPVGIDDRRWFGLEAPVLQAVQAWLKPYDPPEAISNIVPYWSVVALLALIVAFASGVGADPVVQVAAVAVAIGVMRSPTTRFFVDAFQPNYFSIVCIAAGNTCALVFARRRAGMSLAGLGVAAMPQSFILAATMVPWVAWSRDGTRFRLRRSVALVGLLGLPLLLWVAGSYAFVLRGRAAVFPSVGLLAMGRPDGAAGRLLVDQIGYAGPGLVSAALLLTGAAAVGALRRGRLVEGVLVAGPWAGFLVTFVVLYPFFTSNTYYGSYLVLASVLGAMTAMDVMTRTPAPSSPRRRWVLPGMLLLLAVGTPVAVITPGGRPWSNDYVYEQLASRRSVPEVCQPEALRDFLRGVPSDVPILLDCETFDPTCRTATGYRGRNFPSEEFEDSGSLQVARDASASAALFVACETYRRRDPSSYAARFLAEAADVAWTQGGWVVYRLRPAETASAHGRADTAARGVRPDS